MEEIAYKSFCWSMGTTSFRTKNFNRTIEKQLELLNEFWKIHKNTLWSSNVDLQSKYYDFMKENNFIVGDAINKSKDAREKTSGLADIGLIDDDRKLTEVGKKLLEISSSGNFETDNFLNIDKDAFIYLKQLLKMSSNVNKKVVRPFIILIYLLIDLEYLTFDEFTYLLPLCIDEDSTIQVLEYIKKYRNNQISIDDIIVDRLLEMSNYKKAYVIFMEYNVDKDIICTIGMNRKSRSYDAPYIDLYLALKEVFLNKNEDAIFDLLETTKKINIGTLWRNYLFNNINKKAVKKDKSRCLNDSVFCKIKNENELKMAFFKILHLLKAKATLNDYFDLNKRYFKVTNIILFEDQKVRLDVIPKYFFGNIKNNLYNIAFTKSDKLHKNVEFDEINECFKFNEKVIVDGINNEYKTHIKNINEAISVYDDKRYERFNKLIESKFSDDKLLKILDLIDERNDLEVNNMVCDDADIPTIYEYILGIIWYKLSELKGKILDYMKLSLDADLLPITHAVGGDADIVYEYDECKDFPKHTLLIEATLSDSLNQRKMEMEPVSRHLGQYILKTKKLAYCVFVTNNLNINVIEDFRNRKNTKFYDSNDFDNYVDGMKIIPIENDNLKDFIKNKMNYATLYKFFDKLHNLDIVSPMWKTYLKNQNISISQMDL